MIVLSLFDGISCGRIALERVGIHVERYYASEIDKYAKHVSNKNYPDIIQLGDVTKWREWDINWNEIDLLLAGFPCQAWSIAGKQGGFNDQRGMLGKTTVDILNHLKTINPNIKFLFENVRMKKENLDMFDGLFGVKHVMINSSLVSAQNRLRAYWLNWECEQPEDKGIFLKDIVHENNNEILNTSISTFNVNPSGNGMNGNVYCVNNEKSNTLTTNKGEGQKISIPLDEYIVPFDKTLQILDKEVERGKVGYFRKDSQANRVYFIHDKAVTLCGEAEGGAAKMGMYLFGCITPDRINKRQNGQRFSDGKKFYTLTAQDQHGVLIEGYIRKLTPVECERLQTMPDGWTDGISNSKRYKCLGNSWTVDIVAHILQSLNLPK